MAILRSQGMNGPGILYVTSKIAATDILDEKTYMHWYEEDHIAEIIETSGIKSAFRFTHVDPKPSKPFLVMYPMKDIAFTQGDEFKKIRVHSDMLPNGGPIYDLADIDVRYYKLYEVYDPEDSKQNRVKTLFTAAYELGPNTTERDYDDWYQREHLPMIAKLPGFVRCTRYKLEYYRTNAQSRELKGLPARDEDKEIEVPPTYMNIFEFDSADLDMRALAKTGDTEWSKRIINDAKRREAGIYHSAGAYGEKKFFQEGTI